MEFGADFSHDEGKDDLLALRAALDNYHRADEPWVEKPFEATLLTARKIILSDETMGAIADLEIRLARYDTLIGCSPYRSTVVQLMSRFEGVCAAVANGFKPDWRTCCYLDYYLAHGAVPAVGLSAALAKAEAPTARPCSRRFAPTRSRPSSRGFWKRSSPPPVSRQSASLPSTTPSAEPSTPPGSSA